MIRVFCFKFFLIFSLTFFPNQSVCQHDFYLGVGSISTIAKIKDQINNNYYERNNRDFALYYGNNIIWNNRFMTVLEVFYLNHEVVLSQNRSSNAISQFELHQNIGIGVKPGFYSGKHSVHLCLGVLGVYVFDKSLQNSSQYDHFDESYYYGMEYNYDISKQLSCNLGVLLSEFKSNSYFTESTLRDFAVFQIALHYHFF